MTVETKLRSAMAEAVAPAHADMDHLVAAARRRGMGIRRRRQALRAVGVAAALATVMLAPSVVAGDREQVRGPATAGAAGTDPVTLDTTTTDPFDGRSTAAALLYAVGLAEEGTATGFHGQGDPAVFGETYAYFRFTPSGSETAGEVAINVQPNFFGSTVKPGDAPAERTAACQSWMQHCSSSLLPDGSRLTSYDDRSGHGDKRGVRRVVSLYRTDGVRLLASASNGYDVTEKDERITRDDPVLTTDQLTTVVEQAWWGARLPHVFTEQGNDLQPYTQIGHEDAVATATPSSKG